MLGTASAGRSLVPPSIRPSHRISGGGFVLAILLFAAAVAGCGSDGEPSTASVPPMTSDSTATVTGAGARGTTTGTGTTSRRPEPPGDSASKPLQRLLSAADCLRDREISDCKESGLQFSTDEDGSTTVDLEIAGVPYRIEVDEQGDVTRTCFAPGEADCEPSGTW